MNRQEFFEKNTPNKKFLHSVDISKILEISQATLCVWRKKRFGPSFIKLTNGIFLYPRHEFIKWIQEKYIEKED